jgi:hypothetical protein
VGQREGRTEAADQANAAAVIPVSITALFKAYGALKKLMLRNAFLAK